jgi:hypothetical protein
MIRVWRAIARWWREAGTAATLHHLPDHVKRDIGLMSDDPILTLERIRGRKIYRLASIPAISDTRL